jgi:hypothetical protein
MRNPASTIAVAYICRGADPDWHSSCSRFVRSYQRFRPGTAHSLHVIFKGFGDHVPLGEAKALFGLVPHREVFLGDANFDIGAYIEWANQIDEDLICALNSSSEILAEDWLLKLVVNIMLPNVGLVGATASYESIKDWDESFPAFPNVHVRSNAFMIGRELFCRITKSQMIGDKLDAFHFESGPQSLTRKVLKSGLEIRLVGRNGRGYSPEWWPTSDTFRLGRQGNLLVADNQTRSFNEFNWEEKREFVARTWGHYIREVELLR